VCSSDLITKKIIENESPEQNFKTYNPEPHRKINNNKKRKRVSMKMT
jgi:hypothetical protein